jgi:hypothetical protein
MDGGIETALPDEIMALEAVALRLLGYVSSPKLLSANETRR